MKNQVNIGPYELYIYLKDPTGIAHLEEFQDVDKTKQIISLFLENDELRNKYLRPITEEELAEHETVENFIQTKIVSIALSETSNNIIEFPSSQSLSQKRNENQQIKLEVLSSNIIEAANSLGTDKVIPIGDIKFKNYSIEMRYIDENNLEIFFKTYKNLELKNLFMILVDEDTTKYRLNKIPFLGAGDSLTIGINLTEIPFDPDKIAEKKQIIQLEVLTKLN